MINKTIIIAEAGVNHNGCIETAKKLIDVAVDSKADYIKFQTFKTDKVISPLARKAKYQIDNSINEDETQFEMVKKLELNEQAHVILQQYCKDKGIKFLSTPFDDDSIDLLEKMNVDFFKIPSGEINNTPFLERIALKSKPVVISTGMADMNEIEYALNIFLKGGIRLDDITVLHCNTQYPTEMGDVNLSAMNTIADTFNVKVGYSDHTLGIEIPIAAVARGATVIEKHFTLDKSMAGPDHKASLEPNELKEMVQCIRNIEIALGDGIKRPSDSEKNNLHIARRSIHLAKNVNQGSIISYEDLIMLRPGDGLAPTSLNEVVGRTANKDLKKNVKLSFDDLC